MDLSAGCWDDLADPWSGNAGLHDFHELPMTARLGPPATCQARPCHQSVPTRPPNAAVRHHWEVGDRLHWRLDVVMNEDQDRTRPGHPRQDLAVLRPIALNAMQQEPSKDPLRGKLQQAAGNDAYLAKVSALI